MIKLKISNPDLSGEEQSYLTADIGVGATTIWVRNSDNFNVGWYAVIGEPGQEQTELVRVTVVPSASSLTSTATIFGHSKSTTVFRSEFNQLCVERKPLGGGFVEVAKYNIEWDNADRMSYIAISAGRTTDTYRWRFYNSFTTDYSTYSDELAGTGIGRYELGNVIELVKRNPVGQTIDDDIIIDYANEYTALVYDEIPKAWWFTKEGTPLLTTASTYKYSISSNWSDFLSMKYLLYRYIHGSVDETYPLTFSPPQEFYNMKGDANQSTNDSVRFWTLLPPDASSAKGYIGLHPTPKTAVCYLKPVYSFDLAPMDSFGDALVVPYPKGYSDYVLYRIFDDIKSDSGTADRFNARVLRSLVALKRRARRQLGQPELFRFRGTRGWSKQFGSGGLVDFQVQKELYY